MFPMARSPTGGVGMPYAKPWSAEEETILKEMVMAGTYSAAAIGERLGGRTRNEVIAKIHRKKWLYGRFAPKPAGTHGGGRPRAMLVPKAPGIPTKKFTSGLNFSVYRTNLGPSEGRIRELPMVEERPDSPEMLRLAKKALRIPLLELGSCQCRYPISIETGTVFCGLPTVDPLTSWCPGHFKLVYRAPPPRKAA